IDFTATPASLARPTTPKVTFLAHLNYDPQPENVKPGGEVDLVEVAPSGARTILSRTFLDYRPDRPCSTYPQDSVVFGDDGVNSDFCPSRQANSVADWKFSLPVGLHRLIASYVGSGNGDANFQPADSAVMLY